MVKRNKKPAAADQGASESAGGDKTNGAPPSMPSTPLVIGRNKHWRYISSFHGPWLSLPLEVLETLANANYYMPVPRPVEPAVFYDLMKIRRLVDEATDLAVQAASGVTNAAGSSSLAGSNAQYMQALGLYSNQGGMKLSAERRHRLRKEATQKLCRAYFIDEIASSVATMQSSSTLENVAGLVLQRAAGDADATYVHFFHEKIPSRQLAESTTFDALNLVIGSRPGECEPFRTRATVRVFKDDHDGAVKDLTDALTFFRFQRGPHNKSSNNESRQLVRWKGRRRDMPTLDERDQPTSTEAQLLFQRAGCYLTLACDNVADSLSDDDVSDKTSPKDEMAEGMKGLDLEPGPDGEDEAMAPAAPEAATTAAKASRKQLESRKNVRLYAKRALKDYLDFLRTLHYSPNLPVAVTEYFAHQVNQTANRERRYSAKWRGSSQFPAALADGAAEHTVYNVADLFNATPPTDLPPYPSYVLVSNKGVPIDPPDTTTEFVTYHPLLPDALHSLLLCHALIQTSSREMQRHAYMVARLARLADGYPIFQASRAPARADWIEILRRAENWISLSSSWEALCSPAPLPAKLTTISGDEIGNAAANSIRQLVKSANLLTESGEETEEKRKERQRHQVILDALADDRVNDEASFKAAVLAREQRAEADHHNATMPKELAPTDAFGPAPVVATVPKRWAVDDGREYPILTERAEAVARWIQEAPAGSGVEGGKKKRKKPAGAGKRAAATTPPAGGPASSEAVEA